jgi:tetratricopeptide (TPR) repeat protein
MALDSKRERSSLVLILSAVVSLLVVAGACVGGAVYYRVVYRPQKWKADASAAFDKKDWRTAKINYSSYLSKFPKDMEALEKYAQCNLNSTTNRVRTLIDAAKAYHLLNVANESHDPVLQHKIFELYRKAEVWPDVEYVADMTLLTTPDDPDALFYKALANEQMNRNEEAIEVYQKLADKEVDRPELYGKLARLLADVNRKESGDELLQKAILKWPEKPELHLEYYGFLLRTGDTDAADLELKKALELGPENVDVLIASGRDALSDRLTDRALEIGKRIVELDPNRGEGYAIVASALQRSGDEESALEVIAGMDPLVRVDSPHLIVSQTELLIGLKRYPEATKAIEEYVGAYPNQLSMKDYFDGRIALAQEDFSEAITKLNIARGNLPTFPNVVYYLAQAYLRYGQRDQAKVHFDAYLRLNPDDQDARLIVLREFPETGTAAEADSLADALIKAEGSGPERLVSSALALFDSAYRKGTMAAAAGRVEQMLREAIRRAPDKAQGYTALADVHAALADFKKAQQSIDAAVAAGVKPTELLLTRASLSLAQGDAESAKQRYDEAAAANTLTLDDYKNWIQLYSARRQPVLSDFVFEMAQNKLPDNDKIAFQIFRAEHLLARNDLENAAKDIDALLSKTVEDAKLKEEIAALKLDLAERQLMSEDKGKIALAAKEIESAYQAEPANIKYKLLKAELLARQENPDLAGAKALFGQVLTGQSGNVAALVGLANVLRISGDLEGAIAQCMQAVQSSTNHGPARLFAAELLIEQLRFSEAQAVLSPVLAKDPGDLRAVRLAITCYLAEGNTAGIEKMLKKVEAAVQGDPIAKERVAEWKGTLTSAKASPESEKQLRAEFEANPESLSNARNLASALARTGRIAEAETILKDYVSRHDTDADAWASLASIYLTLSSSEPSKLEMASTTLSRALLRDAKNPYALHEMIRLKSMQGHSAEALAYCNRYLEFRPGDVDVQYRKAAILAKQRRFDDALQAINLALSASSQAEYLVLRGFIYLDMARYKDALDSFQSALTDIEKPNTMLYCALADAYANIGDLTRAKSYFASAEELEKQGDKGDPIRMGRVRELLQSKEAK